MSEIESEIRRLQELRSNGAVNTDNENAFGISLSGQGDDFDSTIYGSIDKQQYLSSVPGDFDEDEEDGIIASHPSSKKVHEQREKIEESESEPLDGKYREQFGSGLVNTRISDRESEVFI